VPKVSAIGDSMAEGVCRIRKIFIVRGSWYQKVRGSVLQTV